MRVFAPSLPSVVTTDFLYAGVQYRRGQPFPHHELRTPELTLKGLYLGNLIDFVQPAAPAAAVAPLPLPVPMPLATKQGVPQLNSRRA